jgi:hypothetical protein
LHITTHLLVLSAPDVRKEWALSVTDDQTTIVRDTLASRATTVTPVDQGKTKREASHQVLDKYKTHAIDDLYAFSDYPSDGDDDRDSPASKKLGPKPKAATFDPYKDWDNGEPLTTEQRQSIMALKSNYERSRAMNQLRNQRQLKELDLQAAARSALDGGKVEKRKRPGKDQGKAKESPKPVDKPAKPTSTVNG